VPDSSFGDFLKKNRNMFPDWFTSAIVYVMGPRTNHNLETFNFCYKPANYNLFLLHLIMMRIKLIGNTDDYRENFTD
jgi:hypothetical protein